LIGGGDGGDVDGGAAAEGMKEVRRGREEWKEEEEEMHEGGNMCRGYGVGVERKEKEQRR
jgi:hypothetical protein